MYDLIAEATKEEKPVVKAPPKPAPVVPELSLEEQAIADVSIVFPICYKHLHFSLSAPDNNAIL